METPVLDLATLTEQVLVGVVKGILVSLPFFKRSFGTVMHRHPCVFSNPSECIAFTQLQGPHVSGSIAVPPSVQGLAEGPGPHQPGPAGIAKRACASHSSERF